MNNAINVAQFRYVKMLFGSLVSIEIMCNAMRYNKLSMIITINVMAMSKLTTA